MRNVLFTAVAVALSSTSLLACGAGASSEGTTDQEQTDGNPSDGTPSSSLASAPVTTPGQPAAPTAPARGSRSGSAGNDPAPGAPGVDPNAGAGPKPTNTCAISKDSAGFFTLTSSKSSYVAYVPASYDGTKPMRLIVGIHGCGDSAMNFATWGVNPYDTRATQQHIGISLGGKDGQCWSMGGDDDRVAAAVESISRCFWVHQKKVVVGGYSSGGQLAYRVGLQDASRYAGIIIEDSGLYASGTPSTTLLTNAAWKVNIAHLTHTSDTTFPLAQVKADWAATKAAGFPLLTSETAGTHDGTSDDWANWLIPQSASWLAP